MDTAKNQTTRNEKKGDKKDAVEEKESKKLDIKRIVVRTGVKAGHFENCR